MDKLLLALLLTIVALAVVVGRLIVILSRIAYRGLTSFVRWARVRLKVFWREYMAKKQLSKWKSGNTRYTQSEQDAIDKKFREQPGWHRGAKVRRRPKK